MDGHNFNSYNLVRVSNLGQDAQNLDDLGNFDTILSIVSLEDGSWELLVSKSDFPKLKDICFIRWYLIAPSNRTMVPPILTRKK